MIVMSTLVVGGLLSATQHMMPVLFTTLTHNSMNALSDEPPAPRASLRSPAPEEARTPSGFTTVSVSPMQAMGSLPQPQMATEAPQYEAPPDAQMGLSSYNTGDSDSPSPSLNNNASIQDTPPRAAEGPTLAPSPAIYPGPSPAPEPVVAPPTKVAPSPGLSPMPMPAAPPLS